MAEEDLNGFDASRRNFIEFLFRAGGTLWAGAYLYWLNTVLNPQRPAESADYIEDTPPENTAQPDIKAFLDDDLISAQNEPWWQVPKIILGKSRGASESKMEDIALSGSSSVDRPGSQSLLSWCRFPDGSFYQSLAPFYYADSIDLRALSDGSPTLWGINFCLPIDFVSHDQVKRNFPYRMLLAPSEGVTAEFIGRRTRPGKGHLATFDDFSLKDNNLPMNPSTLWGWTVTVDLDTVPAGLKKYDPENFKYGNDQYTKRRLLAYEPGQSKNNEPTIKAWVSRVVIPQTKLKSNLFVQEGKNDFPKEPVFGASIIYNSLKA